jgi:hypothetical protein
MGAQTLTALMRKQPLLKRMYSMWLELSTTRKRDVLAITRALLNEEVANKKLARR